MYGGTGWGADPPPASELRPDARCVAQGGGDGGGYAIQLGSLLPALRRSGRRALRVLDAGGGDGGGHGESRVRGSGHVQLVPEPELAGRYGAYGGPCLRRPAHPRYRGRVVSEGLRRVRLRVRDGGEQAEGAGRRDAGDRGAARKHESPSGAGPVADPDR